MNVFKNLCCGILNNFQGRPKIYANQFLSGSNLVGMPLIHNPLFKFEYFNTQNVGRLTKE